MSRKGKGLLTPELAAGAGRVRSGYGIVVYGGARSAFARIGLVFVRLQHAQLAMPPGEEAAARSFYADVLGMTEVVKPPPLAARGGAWFRAGDAELHLGVEDDFRPARKAHPGVLVDDLDGLTVRLASADVVTVRDDDLPGFRRIYVYDPFGNRLEFLQTSP